MVTPSQHKGKKGNSTYPPSYTSTQNKESKYKQEYTYCTHIHRACCKRLWSPVQRQLFYNLLRTLVSPFLKGIVCFRLTCKLSCRGTSVEVRYHKVHCLLYAVRPLRCILKIQSAAGFLSCLHLLCSIGRRIIGKKLTAPPHCVLCILIGRPQMVYVGCYSQQTCHKYND